jgi:hypothetical protein
LRSHPQREAPESPAAEDRVTIHRTGGRVWAGAAIGYLLVGAIVLFPSIMPGRTLLSADLVTASSPYRELAGGLRVHNPLLSDPAFQFAPWLEYLGDELAAGRFPRWNPRILAGTQVTPNGWISAYYPPFWVAGFLDVFDAYNILVVAHLAWAALGLFALSRSIGASTTAAWVAGLTAFVAQFWVHWALHLSNLVAFAWLPWVMFATYRVVVSPSARTVGFLGAAFGLWWLGANPQYAYYGTLAAGAFGAVLLFLLRREPVRLRVAALVAGPAVGLALAAPSLLPLMSLQDEIVRQGESARSVTETHLPSDHVARWIVPGSEGSALDGFYPSGYVGEWEMDSPFLGITALVLAGAGLASGRGAARWLLFGGAVAVSVLGLAPWLHEVFYRVVPAYDRFRVSARWFSILPVFVAPLAAIGIDRLRSTASIVRPILVGIGVVLVAIAWTWIDADPGTTLSRSTPIFRSAMAAVPMIAVGAALIVQRRWPLAAVVVVGGSMLLEAFVHTTRWFPTVSQEDAYRPVPAAVVAQRTGGRMVRVSDIREQFYPLAPNLPMMFDANDVQGTAVFFPADYQRYLRMIDDSGAFIRTYNTAPAVIDGALLGSPLVEPLDVRVVVAPNRVGVPPELRLLRRGTLNVYERASAGPGVLVPMAEPVTEGEMWRRIAEPDWSPNQTTYVQGLDEAVHGSGGEILGFELAGADEVWRVRLPRGGFLRVSGRYHEGWRAELDGAPTPVYRTDGVFRGVAVPSGTHTITFSFRNPPEEWGRLSALVALVLISTLMLVPWRRGKAPGLNRTDPMVNSGGSTAGSRAHPRST